MKGSKRAVSLSIFGVLFAGLIFFISCNTIFPKVLNYQTENKQLENVDGMDLLVKLQNVYRSVAKAIMPAVVMISVESEQTVENPYSQFFSDPFFRRFFGDENMGPREYKQKLQMVGSGFIVTKDGYLFSNYHVVRNATKVEVTLADNRKFNAKVVGVDEDTDVALLKINGDNLPTIPLGDSGSVQVGDLVIAVGSPFGLSGTYTTGVVSAIGRPGLNSGFQHFIQTDAAINPGNSGGPLINIKGQVIAINTAIQSQSGGFQGIGYSIPINTVKNVADQIEEHGKVVRGYLGINITGIDSPTRKLLGLSENEGVMVSKDEKGSPAEKAGIKSGDIVISVNGTAVDTPDSLQSTVGEQAPGTSVDIQVLRDKKKMDFNVKLMERPAMNARNNNGGEQNAEPQKGSETYEFLGATFSDASQDLLEKNNAEYGVVINSISEDSILSGVLSEGLIVAGINGTAIKNLKDLKSFADGNKNDKAYTFLIIQDGMMVYRGIER
jgi:serine protease Do